MTKTDGPLAGRTVLLTRPSGRSAELARKLRELGASVSECPTIAFEPPADPAPSRAAIARLDAFDWLVFSSGTGVAFFVREIERQGVDPASIRCRIAAVGPGTAARLSSAGLEPELVAHDSRAEGLAESLARRLRSGERTLWVRPEVARRALPEALQAAGAAMEEAVFYRTVPAQDVAEVAGRICRGVFDVAVFTSPSTFVMLAEGDPDLRHRLVAALEKGAVVAIGPVTEAALRRAGLHAPVVAASPSADAVVAAIRSALDA